jgi:hypothetical protein
MSLRLGSKPPLQLAGPIVAGWVTAGIILFLIYDRLSWTVPIDSDSANAVLQGHTIATGNFLLSGWTLSQASFYLTDLPIYAMLARIKGLTPDVAHEAGAVLYTLLVLGACLLSRGNVRGVTGMGRMVVTLLLLVAPAPGLASRLLLLGPFHVGTTVVLVGVLLVLDRWGQHVLGAVGVGGLLALALLSDALALYVSVLPIGMLTLLRLRNSPRGADLRLLAASVLSVPASLVLAAEIRSLGGFATLPLQGTLARFEEVPRNAALALQGELLLSGANFFDQPFRSPGTLVAMVHLAGVAVVLASVGWVVLAWRRGEETDLLTQILLAGMVVDILAYVFSNRALDLRTSRYLTPCLVFGAVLAGRVGADRLWSGWLRHAAVVLGLACLTCLSLNLRTPAAPSPEAQLSAFLDRQHLNYGVAQYWEASTVTVQSRGRVRVRAVVLVPPRAAAYLWEAEGSWYDPRGPGNDARFVVRDTWDRHAPPRSAIEATFGDPAREYWLGRYEVLVWDRNLLDEVRR